jgi:hypothetical protein
LKDKNVIHLSKVFEETKTEEERHKSRNDSSTSNFRTENSQSKTSEKEVILLKDVLPLESFGIPGVKSDRDRVKKIQETLYVSTGEVTRNNFSEIEISTTSSVFQNASRSPVQISGLRYTTKKPTPISNSTSNSHNTAGATVDQIITTQRSSLVEKVSEVEGEKMNTTKLKNKPVITQEEFLRLYSGLFLTSTTTSAPLSYTSHSELYELFPVMTRPMNKINETEGGDASTTPLSPPSAPSSAAVGEANAATTAAPAVKPLRVITSIDVSVSRHEQNNSMGERWA